jgi:hypothetical protein
VARERRAPAPFGFVAAPFGFVAAPFGFVAAPFGFVAAVVRRRLALEA